ncbi:MAG TPA: NAD(P)-dependent alcohol dehydrogenase [Stellaceae bacterium]|nr:NAD(P)-dependent alcohol dehydrogenase [Stellaceae bacterium]
MKIEAAVVRQPGGPFLRERLALDTPREDEVLVRIVATGLCHSDIIAMHCHFPPPPPVVLGHEGAGVVERVGAAVTHLIPGDHVVLSFNSRGACPACAEDHPAYCQEFFPRNLHGRRVDGSPTLHSADGPVGGAFFGQSSFANFALANERNAVKVRKDAPLELLGPLGCGIQTGFGAVVNVLKPRPGSSFALFGCGGVGLAALMGAKLLGCDPIIAIDKVASRLELATRLGATRVIDAGTEDAAAALAGLGGIDTVVEATGVPAVLAQAIQSTRTRGTCAVLGVPTPESTVTVNIMRSFSGRTVMGITEGDADPHVFIPYMVDRFMAGELPLDLLVKFYTLDEINQAVAESSSGLAIKPILLMPHAS